MYVEQYVSGSCQTLNNPLCKRHEPNASNSRDLDATMLSDVTIAQTDITIAAP